jgi:hypothetical protein
MTGDIKVRLERGKALLEHWHAIKPSNPPLPRVVANPAVAVRIGKGLPTPKGSRGKGQ